MLKAPTRGVLIGVADTAIIEESTSPGEHAWNYYGNSGNKCLDTKDGDSVKPPTHQTEESVREKSREVYERGMRGGRVCERADREAREA